MSHRIGHRIEIADAPEASQFEAIAPDGYHFESGAHVLVEPYGRGQTKREARRLLTERLEPLKKCSEDCGNG